MKQKSLITLLKINLPFLLPYFLFLVAAGIPLLLYPKADIHIYINDHTYGTADTFFRVLTSLGDGVTVAILAIIVFLFRFGNGILIALSGLLAGVCTQTLKHTLFSSMQRPKNFFEGIHQLHLVPGVESYGGHTFPSGHTASAFALYFSLALITENKFLKTLLFFTALFVGLSRVYLSQHFLNDVYAGSLLGFFSCLLAWYLLTHFRPFANASWMERSVFMNKNKTE